MNNFKKIIVTMFTIFNIFAVDDYMYFLVDSMKLSTSVLTNRLDGETFARKIYVLMGNNEFEIQTANNDLFQAKTYLDKDRFTFYKDGIKFSTPLGNSNPVLSITHLDIENAEVELSTEAIRIRGELLNTNFGYLSFYVDNLNMTCNTFGKFSTDIDIACINNNYIIPNDETRNSRIEIKDLSDKKEFEINIESRAVKIEEENLFIESENISGFYRMAHFGLGKGQLSCFKEPLMKDIDVDKLMSGCLKESKISGEKLKFNESGIDLHINTAVVEFLEDKFEISADYAKFMTGKNSTFVAGMMFRCNKNADFNDQNSFIRGCLETSKFKISRLDTSEAIVERTDIKDLNINISQGSFSLEAKPKMVFRIPLKITGKIEHLALVDQLEIRVDQAKVAGISAKSFALKIVKKFFDNNRVSINDDVIVVQL